MLALANMIYFFLDELAGLRARSFSFALVPVGPFECSFFRHARMQAGWGPEVLIAGDQKVIRRTN